MIPKPLLIKIETAHQTWLMLEKQMYAFDYEHQPIKSLLDMQTQAASLQEIAKLYSKLLKSQTIYDELRLLKDDFIWKEVVAQELIDLQAEIDQFESDLIDLIKTPDIDITKSVIIEIRGGVGGSEANYFVADLYRMYSRYAESQKWTVELLELQDVAEGGFGLISCIIKGKDAYQKLQHESGAHRVQRVPKTEANGRIHTSIATVVILKEPPINETPDIKLSDMRIDTFRSQGAGGQHVNTTDSAIRIVHLPTNLVVTCQDGRSQHDNKDKALQLLKSKLYQLQIDKNKSLYNDTRKAKVGDGDRSDKIRTYNYQQNRITDHRLNQSWQQLDIIMEGKMHDIIDAFEHYHEN